MGSYLFVVVGLVAGILSGLLGIGGGIVMVPALIYFFGFSQHGAQGTTLAAMILPIGLLAALKYYSHGHVSIAVAMFIAMGFFVGGFIGASFVEHISETVLRRMFGVCMLVIAIKMIFTK
ncbi:MAG: sulfite exporter TauE/SafE family protein [Candidatus Omnitrophica bacterium]|nr:sulfite exporter TauE/SafE family protein [Candidatus Omnitrophota bacterium]